MGIYVDITYTAVEKQDNKGKAYYVMRAPCKMFINIAKTLNILCYGMRKYNYYD
jgi:hypothetical protein